MGLMVWMLVRVDFGQSEYADDRNDSRPTVLETEDSISTGSKEDRPRVQETKVEYQSSEPPETVVVLTYDETVKQILEQSSQFDHEDYSEEIRTILGLHGDSRLSTRMNALDRLSSNGLTEAEQVALYALLLDSEWRVSLTPVQARLLVNNVLKFLRLRPEKDPRLSVVMVSLFSNKNEDVAVRDYAVQHLGEWYPSAPDQEQLQDIFWEATNEDDTTIAGTALLAIRKQSRLGETFDTERLHDEVLAIAQDEQANPLSRATAIRLAGDLRHPEVLPVVLEMAESEKASTVMRIAAIGAIGELGDASHVPFLEDLTQRAEDLFQPAIKQTLNKINERVNHEETARI